ncbi:MAG TPA: nickel-dependent hydrogenase large subunit [Deltaproteobacteria bacterium]|jgi:Ni,Fe-hydrogenase I large subunit|nr:nickel-dependent hydrogenase large subunit [Deltaproteobacteria bacterium]HOI08637.1 nickel-dependent hydrogenase large subunit [Deltaproteobacteria bacterium]
MSQRIIVDPITRIEGHLRIEAELDGNTVKDAWSTITLWRGFEVILKGRDPRDAPLFVQRFCGVCTYSHYETSILACEEAFGATPPPNARIVRNLINASQYITDHIMHFYHLHGLDWVDIVSALSADPDKAASLAREYSDNPYNSSGSHYKAVQARLKRFVDSGRLGPFANAYWGNPSYKLSPEANLVITSHYLDALSVSKIGAQMMAIFGGKNPHPQTLVVGGVTSAMDLSADRIGMYLYRFKEIEDFVNRAYLPDLIMAAGAYKDEGLAGQGAGVKNYLCMGGFPLTDDWSRTLLPKGVVKGGDISKPLPFDRMKVAEDVTHAWYEGDENLTPWEGKTEPEYTGFDSNGNVKGDGKYTWCKAPNYENEPFEVGPLARFVVGYAQNDPNIKPLVDDTLKATGLPATVLFSTLGRTAARGLETKLICNHVEGWVNELVANMKAGDTRTWTKCAVPREGKGGGCNEVPRGGLSHWIRIEDGTIANYQAVVPSTWNCAPRNKAGKRGPYEEALVGLKVAKADQPLEIIRTIHSFDPCMACAVHIIRPGKDVRQFKVR